MNFLCFVYQIGANQGWEQLKHLILQSIDSDADIL
jgi:hypothetical protein